MGPVGATAIPTLTPKKEKGKMKYVVLLPALLMSIVMALVSCTSTESQANAAKVFDTICVAEPGIYAISVSLANSHGWSASKINKLNTAHAVVYRLCTDRPTNMIAGLVTLTAAYRDILALKSATEA